MSTATVLAALRDALGDAGVLTDPERTGAYLVDMRKYLTGKSPAILRPTSTEEVAALVKIVGAAGLGLVPQGGNTSYCGGATPDESGRQFVVSLERMAKIRSVDPLGFTLSLDAGVILADAQKAAEEAGLTLPMSLGSQGSARIGGLLGTNAGGLSVLRYGMMRDLLLGIEAVLPDGSVLRDMRRLRKNNTGYDVKQCFVGAEGTLGIVTGAVLKLIPQASNRATAWLPLAAAAPLAEMLALMRRETADLISSFEFITTTALGLVAGAEAGLHAGEGGTLLIELSSSSDRVPLDEVLLGAVEQLAERGWIEDGLLASNERQRAEMWRMRGTIPEGELKAGGSIKHDISVPISSVDAFLLRGAEIVAAYDPTFRLSVYGHVGDGNLHYNVLVPQGEERLAFSKRIETELAPQLYDLAAEMDGAFSAEHGVGRLKRGLLERYGDPVRRQTMRRIKTAFDPNNLMNAGAVVAPLG